MDSYIVWIVTFIIVLISVYFYEEHFLNDVVYVKSNLDGMYYLVRNLKDKQDASNLLSEINIKIKKFLKYLKTKYPNNGNIIRLYRNYNEHQISESSPNSRYTSYSINKGEKIIFCIRQRNYKNNTLMDLNTMMFVAIHELSHLMTISIGHSNEFWDNMKFLLKEAIDSPDHIYVYTPYHLKPKKYCGTIITDTPYKL